MAEQNAVTRPAMSGGAHVLSSPAMSMIFSTGFGSVRVGIQVSISLQGLFSSVFVYIREKIISAHPRSSLELAFLAHADSSGRHKATTVVGARRWF